MLYSRLCALKCVCTSAALLIAAPPLGALFTLRTDPMDDGFVQQNVHTLYKPSPFFHFKSLDPSCTPSSPQTAPHRAAHPALFSQVVTQSGRAKEFPLKRSRCVERKAKTHKIRLDTKIEQGLKADTEAVVTRISWN